jgi:hypothetical protein
MPTPDYQVTSRVLLDDAGIQVDSVDERTFPEEHWIIFYVPKESLVAAQSMAGEIERQLNEAASSDVSSFVVTFRPTQATGPEEPVVRRVGLTGTEVDQFVQLLEARSRTSDALPSLKYVEDPRASLSAVGASRHQFIYGRRGVGKTALLLEAKRQAEQSGHATVWINAHVLRQLDAAQAFSVLAEQILASLARFGGTSTGQSFSRLQIEAEKFGELRESGGTEPSQIGMRLPALNQVLRSVLRDGLLRLYIYIDDFYLLPISVQPVFLDYLAAMLRDCDGWLKIASIERLTRPFEPSSRIGLEFPHDARSIDLDVTLEDPAAAQSFLESLVLNYTTTAGLGAPSTIAKSEALGRLVLASGGVPRDYMNLFASSIVIARAARALAREVGKEDVAVAAGRSASGKKRDLELDVATENARRLLTALERISGYVKGLGFTYFLVNAAQQTHPMYDVLGQLVDLRFAHLVQASLSDQHRPGIRYQAYVLDLSEFADIRLKRGLNVLDLEHGRWTWRLTGKARTMEDLSGSKFRDRLRQAPVIDLDEVTEWLGSPAAVASP